MIIDSDRYAEFLEYAEIVECLKKLLKEYQTIKPFTKEYKNLTHVIADIQEILGEKK